MNKKGSIFAKYLLFWLSHIQKGEANEVFKILRVYNSIIHAIRFFLLVVVGSDSGNLKVSGTIADLITWNTINWR